MSVSVVFSAFLLESAFWVPLELSMSTAGVISVGVSVTLVSGTVLVVTAMADFSESFVSSESSAMSTIWVSSVSLEFLIVVSVCASVVASEIATLFSVVVPSVSTSSSVTLIVALGGSGVSSSKPFAELSSPSVVGGGFCGAEFELFGFVELSVLGVVFASLSLFSIKMVLLLILYPSYTSFSLLFFF